MHHSETWKWNTYCNFVLDITDDDLFEFFSHCGEIVSTRAMRNEQGRGKGIAYVNFKVRFSSPLWLLLLLLSINLV